VDAATPGDELVACDPLRARLRLVVCLRRHVAVWASGAGKGAPLHPCCAWCHIGAARRAVATWFVPPAPWLPPEVLPAAQQLAKKRWTQSFPAYREPQAEDRDALRAVSAMTRDDGGLVPDVS
jgi:hypothetical protein